MDKIRLDILGLSSSQSQIGSYALVLGERNGNRRLPIIIGGFEAQAIALEIENIKPNRPMTHDLIYSICRSFSIELKEVIISDLKEGVFFSKLVFEREGVLREVDARPSDAIAIGVRFKVPIFTYEFVLAEAGIVIKEPESAQESEEEDESGEEKEEAQEEVREILPRSEQTTRTGNKSEQIKKLHELMSDAIAREDYEKAAEIRDQISRLENS